VSDNNISKPGNNWITAIAALASMLCCPSFLIAQQFDTSDWSNKSIVNIDFKNSDAQPLSGRVIGLDNRDSGCLLETNHGELKIVFWEDVHNAENTLVEFKPLTIKELEAELAKGDPNVKCLTSDHYIVQYRGSSAYARWIVSLYEKLYDGFYSYWKKQGLELHPPEFPLVVNVFDDKAGYITQGKRDKLAAVEAMIGYYHLHTNQTVSYDLTETQTHTSRGNIVGKETLVSLIRSKPGWERTIATIVHESVHQLAYNSGLQVRLADNPLWLSEGIAMYFEAPDLGSSRGWNGIGKVNQYQFIALRRLSPDLVTNDWITPLVQDDSLFTDGDTVNMAYAQSWALTYYLMKYRSKDFAEYMKEIGKQKPLAPTDPTERLAMFHRHFGDNMLAIERELAKKLSKL
jgi:hypothetical protein